LYIYSSNSNSIYLFIDIAQREEDYKMGKIKKVNQNTANSSKNKLTSKSSKSNHNESEEENALNGINEIRVETTIGDNNNNNNKNKNNNNIANKIIQVELKEFDIVDKQKDARKDGGVGLVSKVKFKATKKSKSENKLSKVVETNRLYSFLLKNMKYVTETNFNENINILTFKII
jgi:hypothetical protein